MPTPGFDEWYIFEHLPNRATLSRLSTAIAFAPFADFGMADQFWSQVEELQPACVAWRFRPAADHSRRGDPWGRGRALSHRGSMNAPGETISMTAGLAAGPEPKLALSTGALKVGLSMQQGFDHLLDLSHRDTAVLGDG